MVYSSNYYVELDCLLDTRLGAIAAYKPDLAAKIALSDWYHTRQHNQLWREFDIEQEAVESLWENRAKVDTLSNARVTKFCYRLRDLISSVRVADAFIPFQQTAKVFIDYCGWDLTRSELDELKKCLESFIVTDQIEFVNIGVEDLTPSLIKQRFNSVSMIDFDKWVNIHIDELKKVAFPSVGVHCPAILMDPDDKVMQKLYTEGLAQDGVRESFACAMRLTFYEPGEFSIIKIT